MSETKEPIMLRLHQNEHIIIKWQVHGVFNQSKFVTKTRERERERL
jgi:hypothetical protein